ncbi:MAG: putative Acyl-CoA dehydrogenase [Pseudonocardiales bacterium]|nr:putative Acyl-CoA dehydrogenase [Pseudonocardiales bacterium]
MDLLPTQDQEDIAEAAADFLAKEMPISGIRKRAHEASAVDPQAWSDCAELGLFGLGLPESVGGAECGVPEEMLLFREVGRRLAPGPFLSTVLAGHVAVAAGDSDLAGRIIAGEVLVGMAQPVVAGEVTGDPLNGELQLIDSVGADYLLVISDRGAGLIETASLNEIRPLQSIDSGTRLARANAAAVSYTYWVPAGEKSLYLRGVVLVAAELTGIAEACRDMSVEYAKTREQFGRPIGVNQAVKHRCADMALVAEKAKAQLFMAAASAEAGAPDAEFQVRSARIVASQAAHGNVAANIQLHGGMGFTSEFDGHLFVERAEVLEHMMDSREEHLAAIISLGAPQ